MDESCTVKYNVSLTGQLKCAFKITVIKNYVSTIRQHENAQLQFNAIWAAVHMVAK